MRGPVPLRALRRGRLAVRAWLPVGGLAMLASIPAWRALAGEPPPTVITSLDVAWVVVTFLLIWRHSSRRCPTCGLSVDVAPAHALRRVRA